MVPIRRSKKNGEKSLLLNSGLSTLPNPKKGLGTLFYLAEVKSRPAMYCLLREKQILSACPVSEQLGSFQSGYEKTFTLYPNILFFFFS